MFSNLFSGVEGTLGLVNALHVNSQKWKYPFLHHIDHECDQAWIILTWKYHQYHFTLVLCTGWLTWPTACRAPHWGKPMMRKAPRSSLGARPWLSRQLCRGRARRPLPQRRRERGRRLYAYSEIDIYNVWVCEWAYVSVMDMIKTIVWRIKIRFRVSSTTPTTQCFSDSRVVCHAHVPRISVCCGSQQRF